MKGFCKSLLLFFTLFVFSCAVEEKLTDGLVVRSAGPVSIETADNGKIFFGNDRIKYNIIYNLKNVIPDSLKIKLIDKNRKVVLDELKYKIINDRLVREIIKKDPQDPKTRVLFKAIDSDSKDKAYRDEFFSNVESNGQMVENKVKEEDLDKVEIFGDFIIPADILEGYYCVQIDIFNKNSSVGMGDINFFISNQSAKIDDVVSLPNIVYPGGEALLSASFPALKYDTEVRWYADNKVIYSSALSKAEKYIVWKAPDAQAVVKVTVGIYPQFPPDGETFDFLPPIQTSLKLFISENQKPAVNEIVDNNNHSVLFYFRGALKDYSFKAKNVTVIKNPQLSFTDNIFGYNFKTGAVELNNFTFFELEGDKIMPFTFRINANWTSKNSGKVFSTFIKNNSFIALEKLESRFILSFNGKSVVFDMSKYNIDKIYNLDVDVIPDYVKKRIDFVWFVNSYAVQSDYIEFDKSKAAPETKIILGDSVSGFDGIIDDFGIYVRDEKNIPSNYKRNFLDMINKKFSKNLVFADGFDKEEKFYTGDYSISGSALTVKTGTVKTKFFDVKKGKMVFNFNVKNSLGYINLSFAGEDGIKNVIKFNLSQNKVFLNGIYLADFALENFNLNFYINFSSEKYFLNIDNKNYPINISDKDSKFQIAFEGATFSLGGWTYSMEEYIYSAPYYKIQE